MGNPKKHTNAQGASSKTPTVKSSTFTRYFKDATAREDEAANSNMAAESAPSSPAPSEGSCGTLTQATDPDIKDLLRNLPSKADMANMIGRLEAALQSKIDAMGTDIQQTKMDYPRQEKKDRPKTLLPQEQNDGEPKR
ncbi:Hypothetical predicted protein [Pelobates cultripes]|uniref:Uncharacterized protein n=1 Tax=Pelobates cultripes TaxID=61616 RepID=A0AAD1TGJ6_PELCU|nr:Hypothetical predicted protein [Pelobates cultripes]CAH2324628.1 Hypothetical predicted protein [Pelobates cultripes]